MSITSINNSTITGTGHTNGTSSKNTENSKLTMDDFFSLMVAQLKNQDMYNTTDNTQFIAQMAQFSMVQALADLSQASSTAYGVSLIGKEVTLATTADDGTIKSTVGIVDSVNLYNGSAKVVVNGKSYELSNVMSVKEPDIIIPKTNLTTNNTDSKAVSSSTNTNATDTKTNTTNTDNAGSNSGGSSI